MKHGEGDAGVGDVPTSHLAEEEGAMRASPVGYSVPGASLAVQGP